MKDSKKVLNLIKKLVAIPSFQSELAIGKFLEEYFKKDLPNFSQKRIPFGKNRFNLLVANSRKINLLFACHIDTVPPSSKGQLIAKGKDKIFGLGTKDMKGGTAAAILAIKSEPRPGVGILFYGDEETNQKGIKKVALLSKKLFSQNPKLIISPESRFNLGVGARGMVVLKIILRGLRAHSARPEQGKDALKGFFNLVNNLENLLNQQTSPLGKTTVTICQLRGGLLGENNKISFHTGTIPDISSGLVSIRNANLKSDGECVLKLCQKIAKRLGVKADITLTQDYPARFTDQRITKKVRKIIEKAVGEKIDIGNPKLAGFNDATILGNKLGCPVINFGPYGEGNHSENEWVDLKSVVNTWIAYRFLIKELCRDL